MNPKAGGGGSRRRNPHRTSYLEKRGWPSLNRAGVAAGADAVSPARASPRLEDADAARNLASATQVFRIVPQEAGAPPSRTNLRTGAGPRPGHGRAPPQSPTVALSARASPVRLRRSQWLSWIGWTIRRSRTSRSTQFCGKQDADETDGLGARRSWRGRRPDCRQERQEESAASAGDLRQGGFGWVEADRGCRHRYCRVRWPQAVMATSAHR